MINRTVFIALALTLALAALPLALAQQGGGNNPNNFNRLLKEGPPCIQSPSEDGIHDPQNPGTKRLQSPVNALASFPDAQAGNCVDWAGALNEGLISPRWSRDNPDAQPTVFDLNIVREVKGSMPNVVYPHKQHTKWLDCSNCHPKIFIPKKGANQISMASILLGEKCGVCHGKVAFPVSNCLKCHSGSKNPPEQAASATDEGAQ